MKINFKEYTGNDTFLDVCSFIQKKEFCCGEKFRVTDGDIILPCSTLVRQADRASEMFTHNKTIPSIEFTLSFICQTSPSFTFDVFNETTYLVMKTYMSEHPENTELDERMAMAAVMMCAFGYELQKLFILRCQVNGHNAKVAHIPPKKRIERRLSTVEEFIKYHIDVIDEENEQILRVCQFEPNAAYFDALRGIKVDKLSPLKKKELIENRAQNALFKEEYPDAALFYFIYKLNKLSPRVFLYDEEREREEETL